MIKLFDDMIAPEALAQRKAEDDQTGLPIEHLKFALKFDQAIRKFDEAIRLNSFQPYRRKHRTINRFKQQKHRTINRLLIIILSVVAMGLYYSMLPADGQTIYHYDKNGSTINTEHYENGRWVQRSKAGNPEGYWQKEGSYWVHRDNNGNFLSKAQQR